MERFRDKKWTLPVTLLGGIGIGAGAVLGVQATEGPSKAAQTIHAYEQYYTDSGRCLHDTPYDPAREAFIDVHYDSQSREDILSDVPLAANAYRPSVLFFAVNRYNEFSPGDQPTEAFLGKLLCPELPQT